MREAEHAQFRLLILPEGPTPPSGGPERDRYLELQGCAALRNAADEFATVIALLGERGSDIPIIDFELVEADESLRRRIQREKRADWISFEETLDASTLAAIEPHVGRSLAAAMGALNYLEDHPLMEEAHSAIHRAAFVKRGLFGCPITRGEDAAYWTDCPISISHLRIGVSAGLVSDFECSVCGHLVEDCDHAMGASYPKVAARDVEGRCTICFQPRCSHQVGDTVLTPAFANARNVKADHVALVRRPRYPLARVVAKTIDLDVYAGHEPRVHEAAELGVLNCDADLGPCNGFNEMRSFLAGGPAPAGSEEAPDFDVYRR